MKSHCIGHEKFRTVFIFDLHSSSGRLPPTFAEPPYSSLIMTKIYLNSERSSTITLAGVLACRLSTDHVVGDADGGEDEDEDEDEDDQVYEENAPARHGESNIVNLTLLR